MSTDKKIARSNNLELWGGIECTINRVNDTFIDQLKYAKHYTRKNDLELIAELGIKTLRYPILWEYHQPDADIGIDWSWSEKQLLKLQELGITPIAGLLHHGSGPSYTNLLDENFATGLAKYAEKVAAKFPWIEYYTPVNEPLTTARFSGLYGFWYPHIQNDVSFVKMLLNQVKGVILSMKAIRKINPKAKLVQTEDLGKTYSTPGLQYQAKFENERRWLTYDLLCGTLDAGHAMWGYLTRLGISEKSLQFFIDNPCPPDVMGFNYYVTSERFLDENLGKYPENTHGGNELQMYADVEAARVPHQQPSGLGVLLKEAWNRYKLPMALTEVQLNCGREDQIRWFKEKWDICAKLKEEGLNIRAVTAWAIFGAFGWNKLLTSKKMDYEPGVFDLRSGTPRPTALTSLIRCLTSSKKYCHPLTEYKGWWQRDIRFVFDANPTQINNTNFNSQPLLIIGKSGTLGKAFARICHSRGINCKPLGRQDVDITDSHQIEAVIKKYNPWAIINAAGFVRVDDAETDADSCFRVNTHAAYLLAAACKRYKIQYLTFSTDLVFDGTKGKPYVETDKINPVNIYGKSKAEAEDAVLAVNPEAIVIRTSSFFGPWDEYNFVTIALKTLYQNQVFTAASDLFISPTYVPDLVNVSLDILIDKEKGIWHLTNKAEITWAELALKVCDKAGLDTGLIKSHPVHKFSWKAARPKYSVLRTEKGILLPTLENALNRYFSERHSITAPLQTANN